MNILENLKQTELFRRVPPGYLKKLAEHLTVAEYAPRDKIISKGEPGDAMYMIVEGEVKIPICDKQGRETMVARLSEGEFFGEMALLTGDPRTADVIAITPVKCIVITKKVFQSLVTRHPSIAKFLTEILAKRLSESNLMISKTVGKYQILRELGRGGMSIVYSAYHPMLQRTVAVKMLDHQLAFDEEFTQRFKHEARIIASLTHPNIVEIYDTEYAYATYFIMMEYLEGVTLEKVITTSGRIDPDTARTILIQTANALAYAHSKGIIHRDVKPSNIMVDKSLQVKLMDFGIARMEKGDPFKEENEIIGTAPYMSPEQIQNKEIDGRCDLYALGVVAYEMLTGSLPFDSEDSFEILHMHLSKQPTPPKVLNPAIPQDLNDFILKALAKKPEDRYPSLEEVKNILSQSTTTNGLTASSQNTVITFQYTQENEAYFQKFVEDIKRLLKNYPQISAGFAQVQPFPDNKPK
ncbi:MAG: hypothetical protein D6805_03045 [Planctomycetota bacterium]|nr:MAG: hypothetical protein D6805_03045 [Planctomycetota bacterium]